MGINTLNSGSKRRIAKKSVLIGAVLCGAAFAQESGGGALSSADWDEKDKNIITVDIGPTASAIGIGQALGLADLIIQSEYRDRVKAKGIGFGIGLQYARRLPYNLAAIGRFDYFTTGLEYDVNDDIPVNGLYKGDYMHFSFTTYYFEGHCRYYPLAKGFFVDGNLGFGNVYFNADTRVTEFNQFGARREVKEKYSPGVSVFKIGPAFGLTETIPFENIGGLVVEFSFGYQFGIPVSKTFTERMVDEGFILLGDGDGEATRQFFDNLEKFLLFGGPRLTVCVGWSF